VVIHLLQQNETIIFKKSKIMKTAIIKSQKMNSSKVIINSVAGFFVGFGVYHFIKVIINLIT
jgi:hypothetical protein